MDDGTPSARPTYEELLERVARLGLPQQELSIRRVLDNMAEGCALLSPEWVYLYVNNANARHAHLTPEQMVGRDMRELIPGVEKSSFFDAYRRCMEERTPHQVESEFTFDDGSSAWYEAKAAPVPEGIFVLSQDITERKRAADALRASENRYRSLAAQLPSVLMRYDREYRVAYLNPLAEKITGIPVAHFLGRTNREVGMPEELCALWEHAIDEVFRSGENRELEFDFPSTHGPRTFLLRFAPERNLDGSVAHVLGISTEITERKHAEEALFAANQRLNALMDSLPVGVSFSDDPTCQRITGNRAGLAQFEVTAVDNLSASAPDADAPGRQVRFFRDGRPITDVDLPLQRAVAEGREIEPMELEIHLPSGRRWFASASGAPVHDREGKVVSGIAVTADITTRKRAEEALREANERLMEADRRKDEFIAILSHELRNPLAPIRYALPLLAKDEERLGDTGRRAIAVIDRQVAHLARLVDDLLDVSRITSGRTELRTEGVTLDAVLRTAVEGASPAIVAAQHSFDIAVPDVPLWLHADPARIAQAVTNLLNNSARYTPKGGRIRLEATTSEAQVLIRVVDSGVGIAADALPTVFELFRQVKGANRSQGGLGIGLFLAKQFVEMHGGTIEARSAGENQGAEFVIRLPLPGAADRAADTRETKPCGGQPACLRVLVVDDNVDSVEMLALVVEASGHQVRKVYDGRSATSAALEYLPHVVLLDVGLPDVSGLEVAKELRRHPEMAGTRIVALTGWGQPEDRRRTAEAGFDDHITKPADPNHVRRLLEGFAANLS